MTWYNVCPGDGSLTITNAQEQDVGKYECVAENEVGVAYSSAAMVYVKGTNPDISLKPGRQGISTLTVTKHTKHMNITAGCFPCSSLQFRKRSLVLSYFLPPPLLSFFCKLQNPRINAAIVNTFCYISHCKTIGLCIKI